MPMKESVFNHSPEVISFVHAHGLEREVGEITVNDLKLSGGVYFVNLTYKNEKITRKLIIQ